MESGSESTAAPQKKNLYDKYGMPVAVFAGLALIAGALYFGDGVPSGGTPQEPGQPTEREVQAALNKIDPVSPQEHIRGNPDAQVVIVEYSDTECPFCKRFHTTLNEIMDEYEAGGQVAWVYRHFPLDSLHQKARHEAVALECAAELGGNDAFWTYTDRLYQITTSNDGLDEAELPRIAAFAGLDATAFANCLVSTRHDAAIEADEADAIETGGRGTPWSVIVTKSGKKYPVNGAMPYDQMKQIVDQALAGG